MYLFRRPWLSLLFAGAISVSGSWTKTIVYAQGPAHAKLNGQTLFTSTCAGCHGADGHGGEHAPNIATSSAVRQLSNAQLSQILNKGIPGAGMPAFGSLGQETIDSVIGYLRELQGAGKGVALPGDPARGEALFFGKAECSTCHAVRGRGGFLADDLTKFGTGQKPDNVHSILANPDDALPKNSGWTRVRTKSGEGLQGVLRAEDNFQISLQTTDGSFHFVDRADIAERKNEAHPGAGGGRGSALSRVEIDDLVSFLIHTGNLEDGLPKSGTKSKE